MNENRRQLGKHSLSNTGTMPFGPLTFLIFIDFLIPHIDGKMKLKKLAFLVEMSVKANKIRKSRLSKVVEDIYGKWTKILISRRTKFASSHTFSESTLIYSNICATIPS